MENCIEQTDLNLKRQYLQKLIDINNSLGDDLDIRLCDALNEEIHKDDFEMQIANIEFFINMVEQFILLKLHKDYTSEKCDHKRLDIYRGNFFYIRKPLIDQIISSCRGKDGNMEDVYVEFKEKFQALDEFILN